MNALVLVLALGQLPGAPGGRGASRDRGIMGTTSDGNGVLIADFRVRPTPSGTSRPRRGGGYQVVVIEPLAIGTSSRPKRADYSLSAQALRVAAVSIRVVSDWPSSRAGHECRRGGPSRSLPPDQVPACPAERRSERAAGPGFRRAMQNSAGFRSSRAHTRSDQEGLISASGDARG
jgi:hypothetical protein